MMWSCNSFSSSVVMLLIVYILLIAGARHDPRSCQVVTALKMKLDVGATCNSSSEEQSLMRCTNLGNITLPSPFITEEEKLHFSACPPPHSSSADSMELVVTHCNPSSGGQQAFWKSFNNYTLPYQQLEHGMTIGPPAIIGLNISDIDPSERIIYVNLTWDSRLMHPRHSPATPPSACRRPQSSTNFSHTYFPASIHFDEPSRSQYTVRISSNTLFLLFNCSSETSSIDDAESQRQVVRDSSLCHQYTGTCEPNLTSMFGGIPSCQQIYGPSGEEEQGTADIPLQQILHSQSCTHFEVFVVSSTGQPDQVAGVKQWLPGVMQVRLINWKCTGNCRLSSGDCVDGNYLGGIEICSQTLFLIILIGGISIGCLLFLAAVCFCSYWCGKRSMKIRRLKIRAIWERQHSVRSNDASNMVTDEVDDLIGLSERPLEFSYKSIESATNSFRNLVGKGGFGVVFKGVLAASRNNVYKHELPSTSKEIAVKVLAVRSHHSKKQFMNEIAIIGRIHHINVVRLLGFCVQREEEMLVYEYVTNGSLDQWLFHENIVENTVTVLDWRQRYNIAVGIARGLSYLHEECRHRIVHCDVKPQNILLDAQMCPKVADFGLARLISRGQSRVITFAKGTPGYMAPELWVGGNIQLSTKADVYGFGMVLLELISGRKNFAHGLPHFPAVTFDASINKGDFDSLVDVRLASSHFSEQDSNIQEQQQEQEQKQEIRTAILVALWCIQDNPAGRPRMSEVVQFLEGVAVVSQHPPHPRIASASGHINVLQQEHSMNIAFSHTELTPR